MTGDDEARRAPPSEEAGTLDPVTGERVATLLERPGFRIERIVSQGHTSPPGFWYDQPQGEWVMVLEGAAVLEFETGPPRRLEAGNHLWIPARQRHRVAWTDPDRATVWLAVHEAAGEGAA